MAGPEPTTVAGFDAVALAAGTDDSMVHVSPPSPNATPTNSSAASPPLMAVADRAGTPLGLFVRSTATEPSKGSTSTSTSTTTDTGATADAKSKTLPPTLRDSSGVSQIPAASGTVDSLPRASAQGRKGYVQGLANAVNASSSFSPNNPSSNGATATTAAPTARTRGRQQHEMLPNGAASRGRAPDGPAAGTVVAVTGSVTGSSLVDLEAEQTGLADQADLAQYAQLADPTVPLHTGSVQPETTIAHPKPKPIVRTASVRKPSSTARSAPPSENIAHLEATAERLSMTSSIDNAIRDLHGELKRSDSTRSSILAANVKAAAATSSAASADDNLDLAASASGLHRHLSISSSIVGTNIAARHGGYSPAAFIMSPSHSLTSRLRSGSANSAGRPEIEVDSIMSRHGPGKSSVRSVRSNKMSLADISESEPISLNQQALDAADASPLIEDEVDETMAQHPEQHGFEMPNTDAFHQMLDDSFASPDPALAKPDLGEIPGWRPIAQGNEPARPESLHSQNTLEQGADAFVDFDGVHWEPTEEDMEPPPEFEPDFVEHELPIPRQGGRNLARPTSYFDTVSGQQMLYYPARVPAMLNLPPKLSAKPNAMERNKRRSQVMTAMVKGGQFGSATSNSPAGSPEITRESWLPDPIADQRESFAFFSNDHLPNAQQPIQLPEPAFQPNSEPDMAQDGLRRPRRLSRMDPRRKSKASQDMLKPQLRASAFFDMPSTTPDVEIKDGSAMATLDSILDASAHAPVSAFTDHMITGKLGSEVYGREKKKHKSRPSMMSLGPVSAEAAPKKRSSFMWLNKRTSSYNSLDKSRSKSMASMPALGAVNADVADNETHALTSSIDGDYAMQPDEDERLSHSDDSNSDEEYDFQGAPTTLLGELQLRKHEQKHRTRNQVAAVTNGTQATLLEMDTVAETQRKFRQGQRVNLAWEEEDSHLDQNGADDEDVPLAIIAAMHQGAKNKADLQRPIGLMERRDIEDNEPLSQRRARLQGRESMPALLHTRQSMMSLSGPRRLGATSPLPEAKTPEPEVEEIDGETLFDRKRRIAGKDGEEELPKARPVSSAFSAELLSQFGDLDDVKEKSAKKDRATTPMPEGVEETLGQRRKRLQAEREAREREMSYSNLVGDDPQPRRMSLANMLSVHPRKDPDLRQQEERRKMEEQMVAARDRDIKMAAMRRAMPTSLPVPNLTRASGFMGGAYNDGMAGSQNLQQSARPSAGMRSSSAMQLPRPATGPVAMNGYGAMGPAQQGYAASNMGGYAMNGMNGAASAYGMNGAASAYGMNGAPSAYGGGIVQQGNMMQGMPVPTGPSDNMVERWRQGVFH